MTMDLRRGFFRFWLVASLGWIGYIAWSEPGLKDSVLAIWQHVPSAAEIAAQQKESDALFDQLEKIGCVERSFDEMSDECLNAYMMSVAAAPDKVEINRDQAWDNVRSAALKAGAAPVAFAGVLLLLLWVTQGFRGRKT